MPTYAQSLTVVTFSGAGGVGASASAAGASGGPSLSLTTTRAGALSYAAGNDWDGAIARRPGANQSMTHQWVNSVSGDTYWVQSSSSPIANAGTSVLLDDSAPATDRWNFAGVEIVPAATAAPAVTLSATTGSVGGPQRDAGEAGDRRHHGRPHALVAAAGRAREACLAVARGLHAVAFAPQTVGEREPQAGTDQVRLSNGAYVLVATSASITVTLPSVTLGASTGAAGGIVTVTANAPGTPGDWAGLYDSGGNAVRWQYLNGTQTLPATGVSGARLTFTIPLTPGTYRIRLNNGSYLLIAHQRSAGGIVRRAPGLTSRGDAVITLR